MKIGFIKRSNQPFSLELYQSRIISNLSKYIEFLPILVVKDDGISEFITINSSNYDIVWDACIAGARSPIQDLKNFKCPIIVTVHDATPFVMKDEFYYRHHSHIERGHLRQENARQNWSWFKDLCAEVITVSNFAKAEIEEVFKIENQKINVIYHGVDSKIYNPNGSKMILEKPYFLNICQYQPVKNIDFTLKAFNKTKYSKDIFFTLIAPTFEIKENYPFLKYISKYSCPEELSDWYRGAIAFVFPSLHESFGLPVLEAMSCKCPVITSKTSGCSEIVKDSGILINPFKEDELIYNLEMLVENSAEKLNYANSGYNRSLEFSWEKSALQHLEVFNKYK